MGKCYRKNLIQQKKIYNLIEYEQKMKRAHGRMYHTTVPLTAFILKIEKNGRN